MDYMPYIQKAYRMIVHDVLKDVADNGIDETSAYYLSFQTNRSDVIIPDFVRARYPEEMTIVLENQFSDLVVSATAFSVGLAFGGVSATVRVPFDALTQFADVNHQFGLALIPVAEQKQTSAEKSAPAKIMSMDEIRKARNMDSQ